MYNLARTDSEIEAQIEEGIWCDDNGVTSFSGLTYEQGVKDALDWVVGNSNDRPLEPTDHEEDEEDDDAG